MSMSSAYGVFDTKEAQEEARKVFDAAEKIPGIMLDTSNIYGSRTNEILIGIPSSLDARTIPLRPID